MIPPIAPTTTASNPQFASLHRHLTSKLLDHDASTHVLNVERTAKSASLRAYHIQAVKDDILKCSLRAISSDTHQGGRSLPLELRELIYTTATYLSEAPGLNISLEDHDLMLQEVTELKSNLHLVSGTLSQHLQSQLNDLLHFSLVVTKHDSQAATRPHGTSSLSSTLTSLLRSIQHDRQVTLPSAHFHLANTVVCILNLHTKLLSAQIRHLELYTHGSLSRYTRAKAEHQAILSAGMSAKSKILLLRTIQAVYTPEAQEALKRQMRHLGKVKEELEERETVVSSELRLYEREGDGMKEVGRRYAAVLREMEDARGEIARLEKGHGESGDKR